MQPLGQQKRTSLDVAACRGHPDCASIAHARTHPTPALRSEASQRSLRFYRDVLSMDDSDAPRRACNDAASPVCSGRPLRHERDHPIRCPEIKIVPVGIDRLEYFYIAEMRSEKSGEVLLRLEFIFAFFLPSDRICNYTISCK